MGAGMRIAEQVTFGGSGLDRAAHLRGDAAAMKRLWGTGRVLPFWRGKPLVAGGGLGWLCADHPEMVARAGRAVFLGQDAGAGWFAVDMSDWQPADLPEGLNSFLDESAQTHPNLPQDHAFAELRRQMVLLDPREAELAATAKALLGWHRSHGFCARCGGKNTLSMAGWQSDCTACGGHHFPRTDPVVIMLITHGNAVLMGRSPQWPEGMFSLLAGFVEPGETVEGAVRREVFEEAGVKVGAVSYLASQPWPFPSSLMLGCRGQALGREITIDPVEIEQALWISREDMVGVFAGQHATILPPRTGAIAQFLLANWLADRLD